MVNDSLKACLGKASKQILDEVVKFLNSHIGDKGLNWLKLGLNVDFKALMNSTKILINGEKHLRSIIDQLIDFLDKNNIDNPEEEAKEIAKHYVKKLIREYINCYRKNGYEPPKDYKELLERLENEL